MAGAEMMFQCRECTEYFPDRGRLESHLLTCIVPQKGTSFSHMWKRVESHQSTKQPAQSEGSTEQQQPSAQEIEKILPLSQPLEPLTQRETVPDTGSEGSQILMQPNPQHELGNSIQENNAPTTVICSGCRRSFKSARGLGMHQRSCKKLTSVNIPLSQNPQEVQLGQSQLSQSQPSQSENREAHRDQLTNSWGDRTNEELRKIVDEMYEEIVFWRKNLFKLPSGAAGKRYIREQTRLINIWVDNMAELSDFSIKMAMCMPAILLQKPSRKSTSKQHTEYLKKRMNLWESGMFDELLTEARSIQEKLETNNKYENIDHKAKVFAKLMLQGKVNAALKVLQKSSELGIADLSPATVNQLQNLHPNGEEANEEILIMRESEPFFDDIIFRNIDENAIAKAAMKTRGAAGPSGLDAEGWRRILISKNYGSDGKALRTAIARMTQVISTKEIPVITDQNKTSLEAYIACRLIPLNKEPSGIRPIGIGEVLRRIIGKAIINEIRPDILESAGCLQLCAGQKAGCEAAAHAMRDIYDDMETDAVLFVDASNAFNSLNRKAMVHNMKYLCPALAIYIKNCYGTPSRLFVSGGVEISSSEGTTQGDPTAMPAYGIGIMPFLSKIKPNDLAAVKHVAYADDIGGGSKLAEIRAWWNKIVEEGPKFGYFPKASKSWLVVKQEKEEEAKIIFGDTGVNITTEGRKYLGGYVGTKEGSENYVKELCDDWVSQLETLAEIARSEPQAAYSGFTAGFKHKLTYFIRTIPDLTEILKPVDDVINNKLIPAITEQQTMSEEDRRLLSLPVRLGGLGIPIFEESSVFEFQSSQRITKQLKDKVIQQERRFTIDRKKDKEIAIELKKERDMRNQQTLENLRQSMSHAQARGNDIAQMKGASAWLTALPLKEEGFALNKREFFDGLALRYRWPLKRLPQKCVCGHPFGMEHAMSCLRGGYVHRRHDRIRDLLAKIMNDVAHEVETEPHLQPLTGEILDTGSNLENEARLDIAARSFWLENEKAFFDVRVFNPFAKTHLRSNLDAVFQNNENQKKIEYNDRVIKVEHGSFTPIVMSSCGGCGVETSRFVKRLAELVANKKDLETSVVSNYIRKKISFELIRSQVACIRGSRSLKKMTLVVDTNEVEVVHCAAQIRE